MRHAPVTEARGTAPERRLEVALGRAGVDGFERAPADVAGRPDFFFRHLRPRPLAVFVDGCQYHFCPIHFRPGHGPATEGEKAHRITREGGALQRSIDSRVRRTLAAAGYAVRAYWEHEVGVDADRCAREVAAVVKGGA